MRFASLLTLMICQFSLAAEPLLEGYFKISTELAADRFKETQKLAAREMTTAKEWLNEKPNTDPQYKNVQQILKGAEELTKANDDKNFRLAYGILSQGAVPFIKTLGVTKDWQLYYCPMAKGYRYWAQPVKDTMANPYMGLKMLKCGSKKNWEVLNGK